MMEIPTLIRTLDPHGARALTEGINLGSDDRHRAVERVIERLRAEVEFPFTLDMMADIACFSPFHFSRLFRSVTGIPPGEFLTALRFERAKHLILKTEMPITDVCFEVGYASLGSFSARFSELVGASPANLRRMVDGSSALFPQDDGMIKRHAKLSISRATLSGTVRLMYPQDVNIFIGLYHTAIAATVPVCGVMVPIEGPYVIEGVPPGNYRLLAAAMPVVGDVITQLLPSGPIQVSADPNPVVIGTVFDQAQRDLSMRILQPTDPPILTALLPPVLTPDAMQATA
jgi:AraC family transcriptional regulator